MITLDLRHAIASVVADAGLGNQGLGNRGCSGGAAETKDAVDPGLRPGGRPGEYASSIAFELAQLDKGRIAPFEIAGGLAVRLKQRCDWIAEAKATGQGYLTITVTPDTIISLADRITAAGPDCVRSDALAGRIVPAPDAAPWETAPTWEEARDRLAARLTARLAVAAGATLAGQAATPVGGAAHAGTGGGESGGTTDRCGERGVEVAGAVAFAGTDAVLFSLATAIPGRPVRVDPRKIARHHPGNPAYAVRYAHARAASGVRWAAALGTGEAGPQRPPAHPEELTLLDALSWLPERAATAARRGRPDEFARFAQRVAEFTLATVTIPTSGRAPGSDRLAIAGAARAGLAASLGLLGISAPDRL
jgi:arginyl-tRNA synthetase